MTDEGDMHETTADEYEYDLAHEEAAAPHPEPPAQAPQLPPDMHAAGTGGDYGHDMAHDMG